METLRSFGLSPTIGLSASRASSVSALSRPESRARTPLISTRPRTPNSLSSSALGVPMRSADALTFGGDRGLGYPLRRSARALGYPPPSRDGSRPPSRALSEAPGGGESWSGSRPASRLGGRESWSRGSLRSVDGMVDGSESDLGPLGPRVYKQVDGVTRGSTVDGDFSATRLAHHVPHVEARPPVNI